MPFDAPRPFPAADPEWTIVQEGFDLRTNRHFEGVFATGSGYMSVRGSLEEGLADDPQDVEYNRLPSDVTLEEPAAGKSKWGTYVPGVVGPHPLLNEEIINLPWFLGISLWFEGERLDMEASGVSDHVRLLNLRDGTLWRRMVWRTAAGLSLDLEWRRFISLARRNLSVQELRIVVRGGGSGGLGDGRGGGCGGGRGGRLRVKAGVDAGVRTNGFNHFVEMRCFEPCGGRVASEVRTNGGNRVVVAATLSLDVRPGSGASRSSVASGRTRGTADAGETAAGLVEEIVLEPGDELRLLKLSSVATDRDLEEEALAGEVARAGALRAADPLGRALATLDAAVASGPAALHAEQAAAWEARWRAADIVIEGDPVAQKALRFSIYHLTRCHPADDPRVAICPKGCAGDAYFGRFFWDTEVYMLPFYIYTDEAAARSLAMFRYRTLPGARWNASALGYRGARYAWESSVGGTEQCSSWHYADFEVHVTGDVVYGLYHYALATGDRDFLERFGAEIMVETSRYWVDRTDPGPAPGSFGLLGVMGPDEYTLFSRNNAFTVHLVKRTLAWTVAVLREMRRERPERYDALAARLGLSEDELELFEAVERGLEIPRAGDLVLQSEDFPYLADLDLARLWPDRGRPLGHFVSRERRYRSKCLKQADVLAMMALFPQDFSAEQLRLAYDYYEPLTSHDSSLSPAVHAIVAAWLGREQEALAFFHRSAGIDLDPAREGAAEGIHAANAGGNWMAVVHGFAGVRNAVQSNVLTVTPSLPASWRSVRFRITWRGSPVELRITHREIFARNLGERPLHAVLAGQEVDLAGGTEVAVPVPVRAEPFAEASSRVGGSQDATTVGGRQDATTVDRPGPGCAS